MVVQSTGFVFGGSKYISQLNINGQKAWTLPEGKEHLLNEKKTCNNLRSIFNLDLVFSPVVRVSIAFTMSSGFQFTEH